MALVTSKENFNPVTERDFGLQLRCGNYYTVGTDIPSNPEETNILITNLRYDFNYHHSLIKLVKKHGAVKKLYPRFMKMRHIALVQFKLHKSALKFMSETSRQYKTQPPMKKFWRKILPVPDEDAGFAAVQAHLTKPPPRSFDTIRPPQAHVKSQNTANNRENFEMYVPAVVPCLEEAGLSDPTANLCKFSSKRKPSLKLTSQRIANPSNVISNIDFIDLEATSQNSISGSSTQAPHVVVIDDVEPKFSEKIPIGSTSLCYASKETHVNDKDIADPILTPAGIKLISHSFKIVPQSGDDSSHFKYIITGSLKPSKILNGYLIIREIPYELNRQARLKPPLSTFGHCQIKPRYLGLRTTAVVRYRVQSNAAACFHGLNKLLGLDDLKIFWMEKIPVLNSLFPYQSIQENGKTDDADIDFAPKARGLVLNNQVMKRFRIRHIERISHKKERLQLQRAANQVCKKWIHSKYNRRRSILSRLRQCNNPKSRIHLEKMLKKLESSPYEIPSKANDNSNFNTRIVKTIYNSPLPNVFPKTIKVKNFFDQEVLINHFKKFGKSSVVSYVVEKSRVVLCKFEVRKEALVAFVKGREMVWIEWGNRKEKTLDLVWEFG